MHEIGVLHKNHWGLVAGWVSARAKILGSSSALGPQCRRLCLHKPKQANSFALGCSIETAC